MYSLSADIPVIKPITSARLGQNMLSFPRYHGRNNKQNKKIYTKY
jgi:hypothetical protein